MSCLSSWTNNQKFGVHILSSSIQYKSVKIIQVFNGKTNI